MSIALPARYRTLALPVDNSELRNSHGHRTDLYNRTTPGVVWPTSGFYDLNRDASRGSAVRTPRGLIAIAARVAHMRYVTHDVISGSDKR